MILRILASILLLLSVLFAPFWVTIILAFAGMAYFSLFLEAVFLLLLSDLLYGAQEPKLFDILGVSFIVGLVCFIIIELFKKKLRIHS